jgi:hypothetical protein
LKLLKQEKKYTKMLVWIDLFSGDEMTSDSYKYRLIHGDACLEVDAKYITVGGNDDIDIGAGNAFGGAEEEAGGDDGGETAINIVHAHKLQEATLSKKDTMAMLKAYLKRVVGLLKEKNKEDRVPGFKAGATEMIKFIMEKFDEMQIFSGENYDMEAGLAFSYTKEGAEEPTFMFFNDGLKEEKF